MTESVNVPGPLKNSNSRSGFRQVPLFSIGFRPFFLLAALYAIISVLLWIVAIGGWVWPGAPGDLLAWHIHEMLFGFVGAAIAGFLLTAISNFTGRLPVQGSLLMALTLAWCLARIGAGFPGVLGETLSLLLTISFPLLLVVVVGREVLGGGRPKDMIIGLLVALFAVGDLVFLLGYRSALDFMPHLVVLLITLFGGRIIPAFTTNWQKRKNIETGRNASLPVIQPWLERLVIPMTLIAGVSIVSMPTSNFAVIAALLTAILHAARLFGWRGWQAFQEPILWILHLGYLWIVIGYALIGISIISFGSVHSAAIHALTTGAMGTLIIGVMSRVALGHTGRLLKVSSLTTLAYVCIFLSAVTRVFAAMTSFYLELIQISALVWLFGFALFVYVYSPILWGPRVDGRPG